MADEKTAVGVDDNIIALERVFNNNTRLKFKSLLICECTYSDLHLSLTLVHKDII